MARSVPLFVARDDREYLWGWSREISDATGVKVCPDHFISVFVGQLRRQREQGKLLHVLSELERAIVRVAVKAEASFGITKRLYEETPDGWLRTDDGPKEAVRVADPEPSRYEIARRVRASLEKRKRPRQQACQDTSRRAHGGIADTGKVRVVVGGHKKRRAV